MATPETWAGLEKTASLGLWWLDGRRRFCCETLAVGDEPGVFHSIQYPEAATALAGPPSHSGHITGTLRWSGQLETNIGYPYTFP